MSLPADAAGEEKVFELERARAWRRSGFIDDTQLAAIEAAVGPVPGLAGAAMRLLLAGLTVAGLGAFYGLFGASGGDAGWFLLFEGALALAAGEALAAALSLHRFGAEEALQLGGCALIALGAARTAAFSHGARPALLAGGAAGAAAFGWVYARRLHPLALPAVLACAAAALAGLEPAHPRAALALLWSGLLALSLLRRAVPDFERDRWQAVQGMLALLVPITLNLRLDAVFGAPARGAGLVYWGSYAAVWLLPGLMLALGARLRHRPLLVGAALALLAALCTNKPYLGLARRDWDPALLGALLVVVAAVLERWLRAGPKSMRDGFTAEEVLVSRGELSAAQALLAASAGAAGVQAGPASRESFGGGGSGGAGASDSF
jgi:hypothetical protein